MNLISAVFPLTEECNPVSTLGIAGLSHALLACGRSFPVIGAIGRKSI